MASLTDVSRVNVVVSDYEKQLNDHIQSRMSAVSKIPRLAIVGISHSNLRAWYDSERGEIIQVSVVIFCSLPSPLPSPEI